MRTTYKNSSLSFAAILIGGLLAMGIAWASPGCGNDVTDKCLRAFERALCDPATGFLCPKPFSNQPSAPGSARAAALSDVSGPAASCCKASDCGDSDRTVLVNSSSVHTFGTMLLVFGIEDTRIDTEKHTIQLAPALRPLKTPLYLHIQSILR